MSESASQLLASFEALPAAEQHELLVTMLQRSNALSAADLSDQHLIQFANGLFQTLDADEPEAKDGKLR